MRRREFIALFGMVAVAWPFIARAQRSIQVRRIGLIIGATEENDPESQARITAFREGLAALGWIEGRNIRIDYRFAGGDADRIQNLVAELVRSGPDLIVANSSPVIAALKQATNTIPVVFAIVVDPVGQGAREGLGACTGDSGGPVFEDRQGTPAIVGVISWSTGPNGSAGCGGLTGVTPLTLYRDWILQIARQWGFAL